MLFFLIHLHDLTIYNLSIFQLQKLRLGGERHEQRHGKAPERVRRAQRWRRTIDLGLDARAEHAIIAEFARAQVVLAHLVRAVAALARAHHRHWALAVQELARCAIAIAVFFARAIRRIARVVLQTFTTSYFIEEREREREREKR